MYWGDGVNAILLILQIKNIYNADCAIRLTKFFNGQCCYCLIHSFNDNGGGSDSQVWVWEGVYFFHF